MRELDPRIFGPGTWTVTHVLGLVSDESGKSGDYKFYERYVFRMVHALPCAKCRRHAVKYINSNPVPKDKSMFEWSVNFHNTVNKRLKKPIVSLEDARKMYENTELVVQNDTSGATCSLNHGCEDSPL